MIACDNVSDFLHKSFHCNDNCIHPHDTNVSCQKSLYI